MTTKCLLVCENDYMIAGVYAVLAKQADIEIYTISAIVDEGLIQTIETLNPDVVILDEGVRTTPPAEFLNLVVSLPEQRVIILNQKDNVLLIYQGEWFEGALVKDLVKVIRNQRLDSRFS